MTVEKCVIDSGKRYGYCNRKILTNEYGCSEYKTHESGFEKQKYRDEEKDIIANNHGLKVVRFRFDEPLDIEHIRNKLVV